MLQKKEKSPSIADLICDLKIKKIQSTFFNQMDLLIDWRLLTNIINKYYTKGNNVVSDKGYQSTKKNKPLTKSEKRFNTLCGTIRFNLERTFGSIKRCFSVENARYKGITKILKNQSFFCNFRFEQRS